MLKTQTITISDITNSLRGTVANPEIPIMHTETKTIMYESAQVSTSNCYTNSAQSHSACAQSQVLIFKGAAGFIRVRFVRNATAIY